jgi:hypothetical protein
MLELMRDTADLISAGQDWFLALPLLLQVLVGAGAVVLLWVLWILVRVILVALRATFRGL